MTPWRWRAEHRRPLPPPRATATIYRAVVEREGRWLIIRIPEIDGVTQARREGEMERMARSLIATMLEVDAADVAVDIDWTTRPEHAGGTE